MFVHIVKDMSYDCLDIAPYCQKAQMNVCSLFNPLCHTLFQASPPLNLSTPTNLLAHPLLTHLPFNKPRNLLTCPVLHPVETGTCNCLPLDWGRNPPHGGNVQTPHKQSWWRFLTSTQETWGSSASHSLYFILALSLHSVIENMHLQTASLWKGSWIILTE